MNAIYQTSRIFIWSFPFLLALALLNSLNFNYFFGFWMLSPYDYPFSYVLALFISLLSSSILLWLIKNTNKDYSPIVLALFLFIGCLLRLSANTQIESFLGSFFLMFIGLFMLVAGSFGITSSSELTTFTVNSISLVIGAIIFYLLFLLLIVIGCLFQFPKPTSRIKRFFYALPAVFLLIFLSWITFKTSDLHPTPGLIIPNQLRHFFGRKQFPGKYEKAIEEIETCFEITGLIGKVQHTALAEGKNSWSMDFDGDDWATISLELIGTKGTAIIKGCAHDNFCYSRIYEDHSKNNEQKLYYGQCLDE